MRQTAVLLNECRLEKAEGILEKGEISEYPEVKSAISLIREVLTSLKKEENHCMLQSTGPLGEGKP